MEYQLQLAKCVALEGCPNFRDLGGYPCADGRATQYNRLYRADCLSKLTESDIDTLAELGITTVVDLRHQSEIDRAPNPLNGRAGFEYVNLSLVDGAAAPDQMDTMPDSLADMYISLADSAQDLLARVYRALLAAEGGAVFHCSAGKDRTGVTAALLLMLAGVEDETVVADYAATYPLMCALFEGQLAAAQTAGIQVPGHLMRSDPENMRAFVAHIHRRYQGARGWFEAAGFSGGEIERLTQKLVEEQL